MSFLEEIRCTISGIIVDVAAIASLSEVEVTQAVPDLHS